MPPERRQLKAHHKRFNTYYHSFSHCSDGPHILQLSEIKLDEERQVTKFVEDLLSRGLPLNISFSRLLLEHGVTLVSCFITRRTLGGRARWTTSARTRH